VIVEWGGGKKNHWGLHFLIFNFMKECKEKGAQVLFAFFLNKG